ERSLRMKIASVELFVLKSPGLYNNPESAEEPLGPTYMGLVKVTTDSGICGYSDMETCASVAKACVDAPRWSQEEGMECFDGLATLIVGQNPLEVERLWYRMYRGSIYYGRRGVAIQAISAIDIALWDICGKVYTTNAPLQKYNFSANCPMRAAVEVPKILPPTAGRSTLVFGFERFVTLNKL